MLMSCHDGATLVLSRGAAVVLPLRGVRWSLASISVDSDTSISTQVRLQSLAAIGSS